MSKLKRKEVREWGLRVGVRHNLDTQLGTIGFLDIAEGKAQASIWQLTEDGIQPFDWDALPWGRRIMVFTIVLDRFGGYRWPNDISPVAP